MRRIPLTSIEVMATVFWGSHGVAVIEYLEKGNIITMSYYVSIFDKLKWSHLKKKIDLLYQDNAPSHISMIAMAKIHELGSNL